MNKIIQTGGKIVEVILGTALVVWIVAGAIFCIYALITPIIDFFSYGM